MASTDRTALVTAATSGLGFEAAAQIAELDHGQVIVSGRTSVKARDAGDRLATRTGRHVFESLDLDLDEIASVEAAAEALIERGGSFDLLVLNAGIAPPGEVTLSPDGIERTIASSIIGHHILTVRLLEAGLIADDASIVIASSEAARGDVPMFHPLDVGAVAAEHYGGDLTAALEAQMRMTPPARYKAGDQYATAKMLVAWWAAELSRRLPSGISVNAVSPGSTPETNALKRAPFLMRNVMVPIFKIIPGMSHGVADGAERYLRVAGMDASVTGQFFASPPKKMTGSLTRMDQPHITDRPSQQAGWEALVKVSGVDLPTSVPLPVPIAPAAGVSGAVLQEAA
jgi:NAD(P)-dependent dehydrogenase (short-subunit alcohol dehydrogenase family)